LPFGPPDVPPTIWWYCVSTSSEESKVALLHLQPVGDISVSPLSEQASKLFHANGLSRTRTVDPINIVGSSMFFCVSVAGPHLGTAA